MELVSIEKSREKKIVMVGVFFLWRGSNKH